jgi:hypothetical protein
VTHLFTVLFFASVLGAAIAILWSVIDENSEAVLANLPWKARRKTAPPAVVVRKAPSILAELRRAY